MNADDAAKLLETSDGISVAHEESAQEGQTEVAIHSVLLLTRFVQAPDLEDSVDLHFIAFVEKGGDLYELGTTFTKLLVAHRCCTRRS